MWSSNLLVLCFLVEIEKAPVALQSIQNDRGRYEKKQTGFWEKFSWKLSAAFNIMLSLWEGFHRNRWKKFFDPRLELLSNRCLRKFESYMIGKTGVWYLRKNLVLFCPPDMQKTQEFPGLFGVVSFLLYPSGGRCRTRSARKSCINGYICCCFLRKSRLSSAVFCCLMTRYFEDKG